MEHQIIAAFDNEGVFVYQAFNHHIADEALRQGTFGRQFKLTRMTWIKPSFGWMLYRSQYATQSEQERILKIKVSRSGFERIVAKGIPTTFKPVLFESIAAWRRALQTSEVRYQWDPDRDLYLRPLSQRALQLGLSGETVKAYIKDWIIALEDVTPLAHEIQDAVRQNRFELPAVPMEKVYPAEAPWLGAPPFLRNSVQS